jgi:O-antigen ligase
LISASFISFISIAGSLVGWRLYGEILQAMNLVYGPAALIPYSRGFVTRASGGAMLQPLAVALYSAIVIVTAYFMMQKKQLKPLFGIPLMLVYLTVLIFTNSRGGWLVAMIGIAMLYYMKLNKVLKLLMSAVGTGLVVSVILFLAVGDLSAIDPEGTFQYRVDLISNSMSAVSNNLLFGSANFMSDPALQASMQGEGIIDIVNMYLEIALRKGLAALIPFIMVFIILIRDMAAKKGVMGTDHKDLLVAILVMIMVFVATCSSTSFIQWYVIIFLAVARAYTGFAEPQTSSVQASTSS